LKKIVFAVAILSAAILVVSCSKGGGRPSDVFNRVQNIKGDNIEAMEPFYTRGTMEVLREFMKIMPEDMKKKGDNKFAQGAKWDVIDEKVEGDKATVRVRFTDHPVEQVKRTEVAFRMKREDGAWKIDMEQEMRLGYEMFKKMQENPEMMKMLRKFQKQ